VRPNGSQPAAVRVNLFFRSVCNGKNMRAPTERPELCITVARHVGRRSPPSRVDNRQGFLEKIVGDDISSRLLRKLRGVLVLIRDPRQLSPTRD
jgi:hypothetical protein